MNFLAILSSGVTTVTVCQTGEFDFGIYHNGVLHDSFPSLPAALRNASFLFLEVATA
jgi:hypothetical protein